MRPAAVTEVCRTSGITSPTSFLLESGSKPDVKMSPEEGIHILRVILALIREFVRD